MKTQISRDTFQPARHYSGVQLQQGRMIVDADWNDLSDITRGRLDAALDDAVASGAPRNGGLALALAGSNLRLMPGRFYVEGVPAAVDGPAAGLALTAQPDYPTAPSLPAGDLRFYADVWERSVSALEEPELMDPGLHGADTATRSQTMAQVKWCDPSVNPSDPAANPPIGDAPLTLRLRAIAAAGDPCDPCAAEVEVDERIGNYLFRVEVHEVARDGADTLLTLKWSRDNGAEAYPSGGTPAGFGQGSWVWEFFDAATERQLGNHLTAGFAPRRGILSDSFTVPPGASDPKNFVRQWDGFAVLNVSTATLVSGVDRGVGLSTALAADAHGRVGIADGVLAVNMELMELTLDFDGRHFVAGDYWLATVREAVQESGDTVLDAAPPRGVRHHYLELGQRIGDALVPPPGVSPDAFSRRMHFPPLTDLTAADIAFTEPPGCAGLYAGAPNVQEALARICEIGAEDIGFALSDPLPSNTVASLLKDQLGATWPNLDGQPKNPSVADMLQALLYRANAAATPYTIPACAGTANTLANLLGFTAGPGQVGTTLDHLLCNLTADQLPLGSPTCPDLISSGASTVLDALDYLCGTRITSCEIAVPVGQLENQLQAFAANTVLTDLSLCLLPGEHLVNAALTITGKRSLRISAAAASASTIYFTAAPATFSAQEISLEGVGFRFAASARLTLQGSRIGASRNIFVRSGTDANAPPMVRVDPLQGGGELSWRDNAMQDIWYRSSDTVGGFVRPDVIGNAEVAAGFQTLLRDPAFGDDPRFNAQIDAVAQDIANMSGTDRLRWRDNLAGVGSADTGALTSEAAGIPRGPMITPSKDRGIGFVSKASVGTSSIDDALPVASSAIDRINAVGNDKEAIADILRTDLIKTLVDSGYGTALALGATTLSGNITDNNIDGELLLMNGQENGIDPERIPIQGFPSPWSGPFVAAFEETRLALTGNRIGRLYAWVPPAAVSGNMFSDAVPGYGSLSLTGNLLMGAGHSAFGSILIAQGNNFGGRQSGANRLGMLVADRAALTANAANIIRLPLRLLCANTPPALSANLITIS